MKKTLITFASLFLILINISTQAQDYIKQYEDRIGKAQWIDLYYRSDGGIDNRPLISKIGDTVYQISVASTRENTINRQLLYSKYYVSGSMTERGEDFIKSMKKIEKLPDTLIVNIKIYKKTLWPLYMYRVNERYTSMNGYLESKCGKWWSIKGDYFNELERIIINPDILLEEPISDKDYQKGLLDCYQYEYIGIGRKLELIKEITIKYP